MTGLTPASLSQVRQVLNDALTPDKVNIFRRGSGLIHLRVLSAAFEGVDEPLAVVERALASRGLRLPEGVMPHLRAPSEVEGDDEELAFFQPPPVETPTWAAAFEMESTGDVPPDDRGLGDTRVVAFWGVKGGVGRTTSLAQVATRFGRQGRRVLAVDLDLDSPGLLAVLGEPLGEGGEIPNELRFDQLLIDAQNPDIDDGILRARVERALRRARGDLPRVDLLGPEMADERFIKNLLGPLHPDRLYRGGRPALRRMLRLAAEAAEADLIVLDARSGYCEESAIAVLDLADQVVVFASPTTGTYGSLAPVFSALERRYQGVGRPGVLHLVAGMLPAGKEARDRILNELPVAYLQARQDIYDALGGEVRVLPSDLSVVAVYYSDLVPENGGGVGMSLDSLGYGELCERIQVTLWPPVPMQARSSTDLKKILEEVEIPAASAESEPDLGRLLELFTRTDDTERLLRRSGALVLGAKGTGKTYLRRVCLEDPSRLNAPQNMQFIDAYSIPRGTTHAGRLITSEMMIELDRKADQLGWRNLWSAIAAFRVLMALPHYSSAVDLPDLARARSADSAVELVQHLCGAAASPLALDEVWSRVDVLARQRGEELMLLFDDLDVVLGRARETEPRREAMLVGLLDRVMASWLTRASLSVKVFLRDDLMRGLPLQDRSKLEQSALKLKWRTEDIWRMLVRAMGVGSPTFKDHIEHGSIKIRLSDLDNCQVEQFVEYLDFLWGHRMGAASNTSATRTLSWVRTRLMDGTERLFPRAALWLLDESLKEQRKKGAPSNPPLIGPPALRAAMPEVAGRRLAELQNESTEAEWEQINRLKGCPSYLSQGDLLKRLQDNGEKQPEEAIKALKELGILELVEKGEQVFARIVDLYAFAPELEISRLGRR